MPNTPTDQVDPLWKRLASFLVQLILFIAVATLFTIAISLLLELTPLTKTTSTIGILFYEWSMPLIGTLLSIYFLDRWQKKKGMSAYGFSVDRLGGSLLIGTLVSLVILLSCFVILILGGWASISSVNLEWNSLFLWFLLFLIQPLAEEVIMRSFLQTQLDIHFGQKTGLFVTALVFAFIHVGNDHMTLLAGIQIFAGGYLMGLLFLYTQNIWATYAMHASWNFIQSVVLGFAVSGLDTYRVLETSTNGPAWLTGGAFGLEGSILSLVLLIGAIIYFSRKVNFSYSLK